MKFSGTDNPPRLQGNTWSSSKAQMESLLADLATMLPYGSHLQRYHRGQSQFHASTGPTALELDKYESDVHAHKRGKHQQRHISGATAHAKCLSSGTPGVYRYTGRAVSMRHSLIMARCCSKPARQQDQACLPVKLPEVQGDALGALH